MKTPQDSYSAAAKLLHWSIALLVLLLIPVGAIMGDLPQGAVQDWMFFLHESFGVTVLALMLPRIVVRLRGAPAPMASLAPFERMLSLSVHRLLYVFLLTTPVVGWLALSAYGLGPDFFGLAKLPALLAKDEPLSKTLFALHAFCGFTVATLVALHLAGVARHVFIKRDELLRRMAPEWFSARTQARD